MKFRGSVGEQHYSNRYANPHIITNCRSWREGQIVLESTSWCFQLSRKFSLRNGIWVEVRRMNRFLPKCGEVRKGDLGTSYAKALFGRGYSSLSN